MCLCIRRKNLCRSNRSFAFFGAQLRLRIFYFIKYLGGKNVVTDGTSKNLISQVVICWTNTGATKEQLIEAVKSAYTVSEESDGFATYAGIISDADYEAIYDYDHGLTTEYPACLGALNHYYADDTLILDIMKVSDLV